MSKCQLPSSPGQSRLPFGFNPQDTAEWIQNLDPRAGMSILHDSLKGWRNVPAKQKMAKTTQSVLLFPDPTDVDAQVKDAMAMNWSQLDDSVFMSEDAYRQDQWGNVTPVRNVLEENNRRRIEEESFDMSRSDYNGSVFSDKNASPNQSNRRKRQPTDTSFGSSLFGSPGSPGIMNQSPGVVDKSFASSYGASPASSKRSPGTGLDDTSLGSLILGSSPASSKRSPAGIGETSFNSSLLASTPGSSKRPGSKPKPSPDSSFGSSFFGSPKGTPRLDDSANKYLASFGRKSPGVAEGRSPRFGSGSNRGSIEQGVDPRLVQTEGRTGKKQGNNNPMLNGSLPIGKIHPFSKFQPHKFDGNTAAGPAPFYNDEVVTADMIYDRVYGDKPPPADKFVIDFEDAEKIRQALRAIPPTKLQIVRLDDDMVKKWQDAKLAAYNIPYANDSITTEVSDMVEDVMSEMIEDNNRELPGVIMDVAENTAINIMDNDRLEGVAHALDQTVPEMIRRKLYELVVAYVRNMFQKALSKTLLGKIIPEMIAGKFACRYPCECAKNRNRNNTDRRLVLAPQPSTFQ